MEKMNLDFHFYSQGSVPKSSPAFVAHLHGQPKTEQELFFILAKLLSFPSYFGHNFDALEELLNDFDWIPETKVVLIHETLPALPTLDLKMYLDILRKAIHNHSKQGRYHFRVWFPQESQKTIVHLMSEFDSRLS